jgi:DNA repair protein RecO (recombination protein O)
MSNFSTPAIMLRRIDFGDYDLIGTFFTLERGKIPIIAKYAKKSTKRFSGLLELFSVLQVVYGTGRGKGLPYLQEAVLKYPFPQIRTDIKKTAYASYWAELIHEWVEEDNRQAPLFYLFQYVLERLNRGASPEKMLSILFQMKFLTMSGLCPNLAHCSVCKIDIDNMKDREFLFDMQLGGIVCNRCASGFSNKLYLSKGTIKQLLWIENKDLERASRIRFAPRTLKEGLDFLEAFVPYHLGKELRSLEFLRQIRG